MKNQLFGLSYGIGVDSTAILVGLHNQGIRPDFIIFADVGAEKSATYLYKGIISEWLEKVGFPQITTVVQPTPKCPYDTIEGNMAMNCTLPSPAFGRPHSCTVRWKINPQEKWHEKQRESHQMWIDGIPILKMIGYDASEVKRMNKAYRCDNPFYRTTHPLIDWGWDREECKARIREAGLPVPDKSSCFFCPNIKADEVRQLTPVERGRIMRIEVHAEPYNETVHGLWRKKSITKFILDEGLVFKWPGDEMPMNPNCGKRKHGYNCKPPHVEWSLKEMIKEQTGFEVPDQPLGEVANDSHDLMLLEMMNA